jgi:membrane protease YdiL (CAAX protease family)
MAKETRNLIVFFAATFIWTWAFYAPLAITGNSPYEMPWMILLILGGAGPSIVGIALVFLTYDKEQRGDYWRRSFSFRRISAAWWLVILLIFPAIIALSVLIDIVLGGSMPGMELALDLIANPVSIPLLVLLWFMSGPIPEEFGWRGYALDPLLKRFGAVSGSVILGTIWGVWHLPLFFMPATWHGQVGFAVYGFWMFIALSIGLALIMTLVYRHTNRSILSGLFLHFTSNFTANLVAPVSHDVEIVRSVVMLAVGLIACMLMEPRAATTQKRAIEGPQPT